MKSCLFLKVRALKYLWLITRAMPACFCGRSSNFSIISAMAGQAEIPILETESEQNLKNMGRNSV